MRKQYMLRLPIQIILSEKFPIFEDFNEIIRTIENEIIPKITNDTILNLEFMCYLPEGLCFFRIENLMQLALALTGENGADLKLFYKNDETGEWI